MCLSISMIPVGLIVGMQGFNASAAYLVLIFGITFIFSFLVSHLITRTITNLTEKINNISKGQLDVKLDKSEIYEINNLTDSLNRIMASLKLAIHKVGVKKGEIFEDVVKAKEIAEKKQEEFLSSIPGWAWETDARGIYTFCSANISDFLGYKPEEIIGKSIFDFMLPEDAKKLRHSFNEVSKQKKPIKYLENWNVNKNGKNVCVETNAYPFFDEDGNLQGYRGVNTDVTNEKMAEEKIVELNKELTDLRMEIAELLNERKKGKDKLLDTIGVKKDKSDGRWSEQEFDSVFIFDENANILDCNENMYKKLGYSKDEMLSLNIVDFDALETKEDLAEKINSAKKNGAHSFKTIHRKKDGSAVLVYENFQYIKNKNAFKCVVREDYSLKKP